jgi:hypothetical protein
VWYSVFSSRGGWLLRRSVVINTLKKGDLLELSRHKFASNVMEKCLEHGDREQRLDLIQAIVGFRLPRTPPCDDKQLERLHAMMIDQYGNYVVQKILEVLPTVSFPTLSFLPTASHGISFTKLLKLSDQS